ncbi:hypothetical protein ACFV3R_22305 [Streptomyces sp. NPDC059740]|uniref:hypothetical protein n=1 Tax=Streptomyces sp. NPDC059740 TaxID=3346926 RepID=UPI0036630CCC
MRSRSGVSAVAAVERSVWQEAPPRRVVPDSVRAASVRAVLVCAVTLVQAMVAFLFTVAGSWWAFPVVLSTVVSVVVTTWAVLDVWITRQVWVQRHGVRSQPSSVAEPVRAVRSHRAAGRRGAADDTAAPHRAAA